MRTAAVQEHGRVLANSLNKPNIGIGFEYLRAPLN